jgi:hypothetical protein
MGLLSMALNSSTYLTSFTAGRFGRHKTKTAYMLRGLHVLTFEYKRNKILYKTQKGRPV